MKYIIPYKALLLVSILFCTSESIAQRNSSTAPIGQYEEISNYEKLKSLGYSEREIFEDLGNANFLLEKYETAVFWYKKLKDLQGSNNLSNNYEKRYQFALEQTAGVKATASNSKNWLQQIKEDYEVKRAFEARKAGLSSREKYQEFDFQPNLRSQSLEYLVEYERNKTFLSENSKGRNKMKRPTYEAPVAVTADGQTAYFSKAVYIKPETGVLSKKQLVYKIYRTDKINGQWKNVREMTLAPKHFSVKHPAISENGKRLFFASNMPGTFGDYDIYAADIKNENAGPAKNLGTKVNTKQNDMFPSIIDGGALVFASEGRDGYGGLDLYMTEVGKNKVDYATNLGSPINSNKDDFSMYLMAEKGIGYVLSNRGKNKNELQQVAFSYSNAKKIAIEEKEKETNLLKALNNDLKIDYTTSVFEDE